MKTEPSYQKLRGGYYTPKSIADFLAQWAICSSDTRVLEPSCGDGVLIRSALEALKKLGAPRLRIPQLVCGVEFELEEATKAKSHFAALGLNAPDHIYTADFFSFCKTQLSLSQRFDAIIGNPPFIRYQNFLEDHRKVAFDLMQQAGLHPNRLTNSWVPFLIASSLLLSEKGRLGMVIPAELFQVNYAAETRQFLSDFYKRITIVTFGKLIFEGIQQEIVLLLCERNGSSEEGIRVVELNHINDLNSFDYNAIANGPLKPMDHSTEKWTQYFLNKEEIELLRRLRKHPKVTLSGKVLDVDVGVVTGQNDFFVLTEEKISKYAIEPHTEPIVSRSAQLQGAIFTKKDWKNNLKKQAPAVLFTPPNLPFEELPKEAQNYIKLGEEANLHTGYKCRIRKRWYVVPSIWTPQAFMLRQVHGYPKIILNEAKATCTDTVHRANFLDGANGKIVAGAFLNSLTFAFAEVTGRSYGGGVLTFEPSEAERLPLPFVGARQLDFEQIDNLLRENDINTVLDITDRVLLRQGMGLSVKEVKMLRGIWQKLSDRRINRKHRK